MEEQIRLDVFLFQHGYTDSRQKAQKLINGGFVKINGKIADKPSQLVDSTFDIVILDNDIDEYVSRGALKLKKALDEFNINVNGLICADIGASTGGFTDLLLKRGASKVYAIENGSSQLHPSLSGNNKVVSLENVNARYIEPGFIPLCDIVVMDVSFISQTLIYDAVNNILKDNGIFVSLIKPQFEVGRENLKKGGIVKSDIVRKKAVEKIIAFAENKSFSLINYIESPIPGGDGNVEYLAYFIKK